MFNLFFFLCAHVSAPSIIEGPRHNITIREHFTCKPSNVVYRISRRCCPALYIRETRCMFREYTGEQLQAITRNLPGFPVVEHFNKPGHRLDSMEVCSVKQYRGLTTPDTDEMCLIIHISTRNCMENSTQH